MNRSMYSMAPDDTISSILTPGGRLTTSTSFALPASTTTINYTPYNHDRVDLWDGYDWRRYKFESMSLSTFTNNTMNDFFLVGEGSGVTLRSIQWTNSTTRAQAVSRFYGRWTLSSNPRWLLVGSGYYNTGNGFYNSANRIGYSNIYNRLLKQLGVVETTASWAYTTSSWRAMNNSAANFLEAVWSVAEYGISGSTLVGHSTSSARGEIAVSMDSTSAIQGIDVQATQTGPTAYGLMSVRWTTNPAVGEHIFWPMEYGRTGVTFFGDNSVGGVGGAGIFAEVLY